jgi:hypothetical protein
MLRKVPELDDTNQLQRRREQFNITLDKILDHLESGTKGVNKRLLSTRKSLAEPNKCEDERSLSNMHISTSVIDVSAILSKRYEGPIVFPLFRERLQSSESPPTLPRCKLARLLNGTLSSFQFTHESPKGNDKQREDAVAATPPEPNAALEKEARSAAHAIEAASKSSRILRLWVNEERSVARATEASKPLSSQVGTRMSPLRRCNSVLPVAIHEKTLLGEGQPSSTSFVEEERREDVRRQAMKKERFHAHRLNRENTEETLRRAAWTYGQSTAHPRGRDPTNAEPSAERIKELLSTVFVRGGDIGTFLRAMEREAAIGGPRRPDLRRSNKDRLGGISKPRSVL